MIPKMNSQSKLKLYMRSLPIMVALVLAMLLAACSDNPEPQTPAKPSVLPIQDWSLIEEQAKGKQVAIHMWGGSESINRYMDDWVAPRLLKQYDIRLKRVPVNDATEFMNKLLAEKTVASANQKADEATGSIDIIWINGENFKTAKDNRLLYGSFAGELPNAKQYINPEAPDLAHDFGVPTDNFEAPWGKAQFVFIYDSAKIKQPPKSMDELLAWAKANPGKFAYPAPPEFTGSAFVRHVLYEWGGGHEAFMGDMSESDFLSKAQPVWKYLNQLEPLLWREGKTYPESLAKLDQLFANGEVWMSMGYDPARATNLVKNKTFPATTKTFVLDAGTLSNTHYLAIPFNAPQPAAALATINFLQSPDAQITKFDPAYWGEDMVLDLQKLSPSERTRLAAIDRGAATLPAEELAAKRVPEMNPRYVEWLEKAWKTNVAQK